MDSATRPSIVSTGGDVGDASLAIVGGRVSVGTQRLGGTVRFVGTTSFSEGIWTGLDIDKPLGKNNGTVHGVEYFKCQDLHGLFVRPTSLFPEFISDLPDISEEVSQVEQAERQELKETQCPIVASGAREVEGNEKPGGDSYPDKADARQAPRQSEAWSPRKLLKGSTKRLSSGKAASNPKAKLASTAPQSIVPGTSIAEFSGAVSSESSVLEKSIPTAEQSIELPGKEKRISKVASKVLPPADDLAHGAHKDILSTGDESISERLQAFNSAMCLQMASVHDRLAACELELGQRAEQHRLQLESIEELVRKRCAEGLEQLQVDQAKSRDRLDTLERWQLEKQDESRPSADTNDVSDAILQSVLAAVREQMGDLESKIAKEAEHRQVSLTALERKIQECEVLASKAKEDFSAIQQDDTCKQSPSNLHEIVTNLQDGFAECATGINVVRTRVDACQEELESHTVKSQEQREDLETRLAGRLDVLVTDLRALGASENMRNQAQQLLEQVPKLEARIDERVDALAINLQAALPTENLVKRTQQLLEQMPKLEARVDACEKLSLSKTAVSPSNAERSELALATTQPPPRFSPFSMFCF